MSYDPDEITDAPFHGCPLAALPELAPSERGRPNPVATRPRAQPLYATDLADNNGRPVGQTGIREQGGSSGGDGWVQQGSDVAQDGENTVPVDTYDVVVNGAIVGRDPDPNIRFQLMREAMQQLRKRL